MLNKNNLRGEEQQRNDYWRNIMNKNKSNMNETHKTIENYKLDC